MCTHIVKLCYRFKWNNVMQKLLNMKKCLPRFHLLDLSLIVIFVYYYSYKNCYSSIPHLHRSSNERNTSILYYLDQYIRIQLFEYKYSLALWKGQVINDSRNIHLYHCYTISPKSTLTIISVSQATRGSMWDLNCNRRVGRWWAF